MDDLDYIDESDANVTPFTLRNPLFSKEEVNALIDLVEDHRHILLDKATNAAACFAKESAWGNICKLFNGKNFPYNRSLENLKLKWDNVKKSARKKSKDLGGNSDPLTNRVVGLLGDSCSNDKVDNQEFSMDDDEHSSDTPLKTIAANSTTNNNEITEYLGIENAILNDDSKDVNGGTSFSRGLRDPNFTPSECNRLLRCVKAEKRFIFCKDISSKAIQSKNKAWDRVAVAFNKNRSHVRSTKSLRTKFDNMKKLAKNMSQGQEGSEKSKGSFLDASRKSPERTYKKEKVEMDFSDEGDLNGHNSDVDDFLIMSMNDLETSNRNIDTEIPGDPLSNMLNGFSLPGSNDHQKEVKELLRLQLELARYRLELAKEERSQKRESHQALMASISARTKLAETETKRAELQIAALNANKQ